MSSYAVAIATAATHTNRMILTLTISPAVFHKSKYNSVLLESSNARQPVKQFSGDITAVAQSPHAH